MHGPCGPRISSPSMQKGKCSMFFPNKLQEQTIVDHEGYTVNRRRSQRKQHCKK